MMRKSLWLFAIVIVSSALSTFSGCSSEEAPVHTPTAEDKAKHNPKPTFKESVETHKKDKED